MMNTQSRNENVGRDMRSRAGFVNTQKSAAGHHEKQLHNFQQPQQYQHTGIIRSVFTNSQESALQQLHNQQRHNYAQHNKAHQFREIQQESDEDHTYNIPSTDGNQLVTLPALPRVTVQEEIGVDHTFYSDIPNFGKTDETIASLSSHMESISLNVNQHPTDYNELTSLSTQADDLSIISIPVNCFSAALYDIDTAQLTIMTPKPSNSEHFDEVKKLRSTVSFLRHHLLSSPKADSLQVSTALYQLRFFIHAYNKTKPNPSRIVPSHPQMPTDKRQIISDYLFNCAIVKSGMSFETYAFGLNIFDRIASHPSIQFHNTEDMQLNGLVSLYLAYKMIEKRIANASAIMHQTTRFTQQQITSREKQLLMALDFNTNPVSLAHIVQQILSLFTHTQQRDIAEDARHHTDNIGSTSGRYVRLTHLLNFVTACVISDFGYTQYNIFAVACAIFMVSLATIHSDFTQIWPLSLLAMLGVVPNDIEQTIQFVLNQVTTVTTPPHNGKKSPFSHLLAYYQNSQCYGVANFAVPTTAGMIQKFKANDGQIEIFLQENNIDPKTIPRLCTLQSQHFSVLSVLDERHVHRHQIPKHSPARKNNSNIMNNRTSPILAKEHSTQMNCMSAQSNKEYLTVLIFDPSQNNCFDTTSQYFDKTQALESALTNTNPITIKIWINEADFEQLSCGEDKLDEYHAAKRDKPASTFVSPFSPKVLPVAPTTPVISHIKPSPITSQVTDPFGFQSPKTSRPRQDTLLLPSAAQQQQILQQHAQIQPNFYNYDALYQPQIVTEQQQKRVRHNPNNANMADKQDCNPGGCNIM